MKRFTTTKSRLFALALFFLAGQAVALTIPDRPAAHVNDYAGLLGAKDQSSLEADLRAFEKSESTQIVVAIFPSLDGESLEDVGIRLAEQWKIGQKDADNGVILLIFPADRKMRIEVGYGLEDRLTDAVSSSILRNEIAPHFKNGDYGQGVNAAVQSIKAAVRGAYAVKDNGNGGDGDISFFSVFLILAFIAFVIYMNRNHGYQRYTHSGSSSGGWSGGSSFGSFSGGGGSFGGGGSSGSW